MFLYKGGKRLFNLDSLNGYREEQGSKLYEVTDMDNNPGAIDWLQGML
jgi:hypothetical protein